MNDKLSNLLRLAFYGDFRPTEQMLAVKTELTAAIDAELEKLHQVWETELPAFNALAREHAVDRVIVEEAEE